MCPSGKVDCPQPFHMDSGFGKRSAPKTLIWVAISLAADRPSQDSRNLKGFFQYNLLPIQGIRNCKHRLLRPAIGSSIT